MTIQIYPPSAAEIAARTALHTLLQPLTPYPKPRDHAVPWGLNRVPLDFRELTESGWTRRLETGEDLGDQTGAEFQEAPPTPEPREPRAASASRDAGGAAAGAPETQGYAWHTSHAGAGAYTYVSTPIIPWPFRIIGFDIDTPNSVTADAWYQYQLYATDQMYDETHEAITEYPLLQPIYSNLSGWTLFGVPLTYRMQSTTTATAARNNPAAAAIGTAVTEGGKRITIGILDEFLQGKRWVGSITVERLDAVRSYASRAGTTPLPPRAPAAARVPTTAARPPAAVRAQAPSAPGPRPSEPAPAVAAAALRRATTQIMGASPRAQTAMVGGQLGTRWTLDEYPGITFANTQEAIVYAAARQVSALPAAQRDAAAAAVRSRAGQIVPGTRELATPVRALLSGLPSRQR